jgi:predicted esterase
MEFTLSHYFVGKTPSIACQADPRFSYCLFVPAGYRERALQPRILVAVHGTDRINQHLRDHFAEFAEATNTIVIAPLFPGGLLVPDDLDNYKYLSFRGIRFDQVVLAMVEQVASRYQLDASTFMLFGFSGGAHFAHRFFYVCPERLSAVVVAAPGSVTLPNTDRPWWPGLRDYAAIFGRDIPWVEMSKVPIHLVVGSRDTNTFEIVTSREHPNWVEGATAAGANRIERLQSLYRELFALQMQVTHEEVPGVGHELVPLVQAAVRFYNAHRLAAIPAKE